MRKQSSMTFREALRLTGLAALSLASLLASPAAQAAPELRYQTTARGRVITTGNTLGLSKSIDENAPGTADSIGTFISLDPTSIDDSPVGTVPWALGTTNAWADNGSTAWLDVPPSDFVSDILYAELVWGGSSVYGGEDVTAELNTPITLSFGSQSITVNPDPVTAYQEDGMAASGFAIHYYLRSAEVTDFVKTHRGGEYAVSGVPATQDLGIDSLNAAGWSLIAVLRDDGELERNLSVFVGGTFVDEDTTENYEFAGFCAPPTGVVNGKAFVSALEGDASFSGDQLSIGETLGGSFVALSGPNNPLGNFFASQLNRINGELDDRGSFGDLNHDAELATNIVGGRQGWDVSVVDVGSGDGSLNAGQSSAVLRVDTTGDSFFPTTVSFEIDVNAPNFNSPNAFTADHTVVYAGDQVDFSLVMENSGTASADSIVLTIPLASQLSLNTFAIDGVNGDASQSPVLTDDLNSGVDIGTIAPATSKTITLSVDVNALPLLPAQALFSLLPTWTYDYITCVGEPAINGNSGFPALDLSAARLELSLSAAELAAQVVEYTAIVDNSGAESTEAVTFDLEIPAGTTYVLDSTFLDGTLVADVGGESAFLNGASFAEPGEADGVLPFGSDVEIRFSVQAAAGDMLDNSVAADPDGSGPAPEVVANAQIDLGGDSGTTNSDTDTDSATDTDTADGSGDEGTGEDGSATDTGSEGGSGFDAEAGSGGGEGCDCRADRSSAGGFAWLFVLFGAASWRRRRRT